MENMDKPQAKIVTLAICAILLLCVVVISWLSLSRFSALDGNHYVYIDNDDTADSVYHKLTENSQVGRLYALKVMGRLTNYRRHVRPGCYDVGNGENTLGVFRRLRGGLQTPVQLTVPSVRTMENMAARLSKQLACDSTELVTAFKNDSLCALYGCDTATLACIFLPNTYEVFWTITPEELLKRMDKESKAFWTDERKAKAEKAGLTEKEVITLASIVDQETANNAEKPMVAGMYLNRLRQGMKLQADPTVKFALKAFGLRRILHEHLTVDSPYNTYLYEGLPPGPISVPSLSSIEAVLNYAEHDYIYMCAKEDFSGTHNFAKTYAEHLKNAAKYTKALNERGIK